MLPNRRSPVIDSTLLLVTVSFSHFRIPIKVLITGKFHPVPNKALIGIARALVGLV